MAGSGGGDAEAGKTVILGGISEENAGEAARTLSPFALDVSGSLEEDGEKSPGKIRAFMQEIERIRTS